MCNPIWAFVTVSSLATVLAQAAGQTQGSPSSISNDPCSDGLLDSFNLGFHVVGTFIVLIASGFGICGAVFLGSASTMPL